MADETIITFLYALIKTGKTPEDAAKDLCLHMDPTKVEDALKEYRRRADQIKIFKEPRTIVDDSVHGSWYIGPSATDKFWPSYQQYLEQKKGWKPESIETLNRATTKIISLLQHPGVARINTRGLVLGYVQSGKTSNYSGVIAKAADAGYKLFVVFSGVLESLRRQTQTRLETELTSSNNDYWISLTDALQDFKETSNASAFLSQHAGYKILCVIKKNASRLQRVIKWLQGAHEEILRACPVILIDDEADQASVNTAKSENSPTVINRLIRQLLEILPKAAYIGYTATPFANMFIDPSVAADLYPKDFIVDLPKPAEYFGPERLFGRERLTDDEDDSNTDGLDMIRIIPDDELPKLKPQLSSKDSFIPELTPSLKNAVIYFWLATAARRVRGQQTQHSTMLIHTTLYASTHEKFRPILNAFKESTVKALDSKDQSWLAEAKRIWESEIFRVPNEEALVYFDQLEPHLHAVVANTDIKIENYISQDRIDYGLAPRISIVIGGNVLSRGLTLEGLVVSYFVRASSSYDTLLQMGRWFGFRPGYSDLPRIWMTNELKQYFFDIATVEQEIRHDILKYENENITPLDFAVRIRTHPALSITAPSKMRKAVQCQISYGGRCIQTIYFYHKDEKWLLNNLEATRSLMMGLQPAKSGSNRKIFFDVSADRIIEFLMVYNFHPKTREFDSRRIKEYMERESPALTLWNVAIISQSSSKLGTIKLSNDVEVNLINRAPLDKPDSEQTAHIKALVSTENIGADLEPKVRSNKYEELIVRRNGVLDSDNNRKGLLLIYPIGKESTPQTEGHVRMKLNAVEHMIGLGMVFPDETKNTSVTYMTAFVEEEIEEPEEALEELDNA